jgi:hypothetical protein
VGMLKPHLHMICMEHQTQPVINGDVLTLGQQAVYSTLQDVRLIMGQYRIRPKDLPEGFNTSNRIPGWKGTSYDRNTNAQTVLTLLGADSVTVTDISAYESPDLLLDLNLPVPSELYDRFDTIVDIGTLEHVFNIAVALENIRKMVRQSGHVVMINPASNFIDHGFYSFSPTLLYDYFNANGFSTVACYLRELNPYAVERKGRLFKYDHVGDESPFMSPLGVEVAFIGRKEKITGATEGVSPFQGLYRNAGWWRAGVEGLDTTIPRPPARSALWRRVRKIGGRVITRARHYHYALAVYYPIAVQKRLFGKGSNLRYVGRY